jgi:hypothetical protein
LRRTRLRQPGSDEVGILLPLRPPSCPHLFSLPSLSPMRVGATTVGGPAAADAGEGARRRPPSEGLADAPRGGLRGGGSRRAVAHQGARDGVRRRVPTMVRPREGRAMEPWSQRRPEWSCSKLALSLPSRSLLQRCKLFSAATTSAQPTSILTANCSRKCLN